MSEEDKHNSFFSREDSPVRVPSAENAWGLMRQQLDVRMPVSVPQHVWLRGARLWTPVVAGVVVAVVGVMLVARKPAGRHAGGAEGKATTATDKMAVKDTAAATVSADSIVSGMKAVDAAASGEKVADATAVTEKVGLPVAGDKVTIADTATATVGGDKEGMSVSTGSGRAEKSGGVDLSSVKDRARSGGKKYVVKSIPGHHSHQDAAALAVIGTGPTRVLPNRLVGGKGAVGVLRGVVKNKPAGSPAVDKSLPAGEGEMIWAAGLWDGEHYTVDAQTKYEWTSSDGKTLLADHLPGAYGRLYMGDRWYIEVGIRPYSPQYTRSVKIDSVSGTTNISNVVTSGDTVVTLKKLYYTDIPVTVHFRVFAGLYLGVGLQYSRLLDGAALQDMTSVSSGGTFTGPNGDFNLDLKKFPHSFDQIKKSDWRVLLDASYYWRRLSAGIRYQEGISPYTESPLTGGLRPRNSSLNVYFSYDIWKQRRKK